MKVLIVDDEQIVRIGLSTLIPWEDYDYELIPEAHNGKEALQYVETYQPHIIITDLKMPVMDGLTFIDALNKQKFLGEIIVLSNYNDFERVKTAMKKGAMDYLLKLTLKKEELLDVLSQAREKIQNKKVIVQQQEEVLKNQQHIILVDFIKRVIQQNTSMDIENEMKRLYIDKNGFKQCSFIYVYLYGGDNDKVTDEDQYTKTISNLLLKSIHNDKAILVPLNKKEYLFLLDMDQVLLDQTITRLNKTLNLYINAQYKISSNTLKCFSSIKQDLAIERKRMFYSDGLEDFTQASIDYHKYSIRLNEFFEGNNLDQIANIINNVLNLAEKENWQPEEVKRFLCFIIEAAKQTVMKWKGQDFRLFDKVKNEINGCYIMDECVPIMKTFIKNMQLSMKSLKANVYRKEIIEVIEYLNNHITSKVHLSELAQIVNLNESYLCRMFKKETGKNITEYHNLLKIEKTKELLMNKDMLIKEIAMEVGIDNPNYLNRLFHKIVGISPKDYKQQF